MKPATFAEYDVFANDAIGADVTIGADLRSRMDDGCGMNVAVVDR
jgi:hypothetical protein